MRRREVLKQDQRPSPQNQVMVIFAAARPDDLPWASETVRREF
jgi:hypothetical protein